jgi:hypothetical protein
MCQWASTPREPAPATLFDQFRNFTALSAVPITRRDFLEFAVNPQLDPADREQPDIGLGLAGNDRIADPELPLPDAGRWPGKSVFDTPVHHRKFPTVLDADFMYKL